MNTEAWLPLTFQRVIMGASVLAAEAGICLLLWTVVRLRFPSRATLPRCAGCGYCITGLPSCTCPECGADLQVVGVLEPGVRGPLRKGMKTLIWSLLLPAPALLLSACCLKLLPPRSYHKSTIFLPSGDSQSYESMSISTRGEGYPFEPIRPSRIEIKINRLLPAGGQKGLASWTMRIEPQSNKYEYDKGWPPVKVQGQGAVTPGLISAWWCAIGMPPDERTQKEAHELAVLLATLSQGNSPGGVSISYFQRHGYGESWEIGHLPPPSWLYWSMTGFWFLIWAVGVGIIHNRRPKNFPKIGMAS